MVDDGRRQFCSGIAMPYLSLNCMVSKSLETRADRGGWRSKGRCDSNACLRFSRRRTRGFKCTSFVVESYEFQWRELQLALRDARGKHRDVRVGMKKQRAHPDLNQGPADLQSAALATELCTHLAVS